jgi:hypothetical protein
MAASTFFTRDKETRSMKLITHPCSAKVKKKEIYTYEVPQMSSWLVEGELYLYLSPVLSTFSLVSANFLSWFPVLR